MCVGHSQGCGVVALCQRWATVKVGMRQQSSLAGAPADANHSSATGSVGLASDSCCSRAAMAAVAVPVPTAAAVGRASGDRHSSGATVLRVVQALEE